MLTYETPEFAECLAVGDEPGVTAWPSLTVAEALRMSDRGRDFPFSGDLTASIPEYAEAILCGRCTAEARHVYRDLDGETVYRACDAHQPGTDEVPDTGPVRRRVAVSTADGIAVDGAWAYAAYTKHRRSEVAS